MKFILSLVRHDFLSTFREPMFRAILVFPVFCFLLIRFGMPPLLENFPVVEPYKQVIIMWACLQSATLFGFVYGFIVLEEKEENLLGVLRIAPVKTSQLVLARQSVGLAISTLVNFSILQWGGVLHMGLGINLLIALQMSLMAPFLMLLLANFAKNRIEGLAAMKIFNILLIAPALIYFLPYDALHALAIVPTYWSYRAIEWSYLEQLYWPIALGFVYYALCLLLLNYRFQKKVLI
ncbi:MAG: hypothetical protein EP332_03940 [Bacteroidetes bacterium]|nr:MAG: hypothetical protein EP332_03940 [Bacteroidota bacterium]